ncbi:MAG: hypothetical protein ABJA86_11565 [Nocardioidaceae bacterium]
MRLAVRVGGVLIAFYWFNDDVVPHAGGSRNRQQAEELAVDWATQQLTAVGARVPADPYAALYTYGYHERVTDP